MAGLESSPPRQTDDNRMCSWQSMVTECVNDSHCRGYGDDVIIHIITIITLFTILLWYNIIVVFN